MPRNPTAAPKRSRGWCFTWNVKPEEKAEAHIALGALAQKKTVTWMCWQWEKAPSTGQLHAQGAVWFALQRPMTAVKKDFPDDKVHLEAAKGTAKQNKEYCSKPVRS